jgi:hypothetical protein
LHAPSTAFPHRRRSGLLPALRRYNRGPAGQCA